MSKQTKPTEWAMERAKLVAKLDAWRAYYKAIHAPTGTSIGEAIRLIELGELPMAKAPPH